MNKAIIIGSPGSGKSTFARALQQATGLPLIYLDQLYWSADRSHVEKSVFQQRLQSVVEQERWIIDGNYASSLEQRLSACDTIFFLDYPTDICLAGVLKRQGQARPDMPWVENSDVLDAEFIKLIQNYRQVNRPQVLELIAQYPEKQAYIFENRGEAQAYLHSLATAKSSFLTER